MKFIKTTVKKRFTRFVMPVAAVLLAFALLPVAAFAATGAQNGLEVSLTTDKSSYAAGETVAVDLAVTNTNPFAVNNVKLEVTLPAGFKLQTGSATLTIASLAAGAAETYSLTALTEAASTSQPGSPQIGDESNILLWIVLLVLSAGGIVTGLYLFKKRHKGAKFPSLFLCFALLTVLAAPVLPARAATVLKGFSVSEGITVDGVGKTSQRK